MKFKDLKTFAKEDEIIPVEILEANSVPGPLEILEQVFSDHGTKSEFQDQFSNIELDDIEWNKIWILGEELIDCSVYSEHFDWFEAVGQRVNRFETDGWNCVDIREEVIEHWEEKGTWLISPIFINGLFIGKKEKYHLVEGHTRVGLLMGLINFGVLSQKNKHWIWYGEIAKGMDEKYKTK